MSEEAKENQSFASFFVCNLHDGDYGQPRFEEARIELFVSVEPPRD